jgi:hypothetical protein
MEAEIKAVFHALKRDDKFKIVGKIQAPKNGKSFVKSTKHAAQKTTQTAQQTTHTAQSIIVEFDSNEARNGLLANAKQLHSIGEYKHVYIRPDRTPAEQETFNSLNEERNRRNNGLSASGKLDQPFHFVIRGDRVHCVDVT